jgi:uncharacterized membrane-anchored protein
MCYGARARQFNAGSKQAQGDAFEAITLKELLVPTLVPGAAPVVARDSSRKTRSRSHLNSVR